MKKYILLFVFALTVVSSSLEAQWVFWGQKYCWGCCCRRYMDFTEANYDCIPYGYVDNINYPDTYRLPRNCCFNYRMCQNRRNDYRYWRDCVRYTNGKVANGCN